MNYIIFSVMMAVAVFSLQLAYDVYQFRKKIYIKGLLGLFISLFIYSFFYALELVAFDLNLMKLLASVQRIGILSVSAFWIIMALEYTHQSKFLNAKIYFLLFLIPVVLVLMNATDNFHHLFYRNYTYVEMYSLSIAKITPGIGYVIAIAFDVLLFLMGCGIFIAFSIKNNLYRKRSYVLMATSLIPIIGLWYYTSHIFSITIDTNPLVIFLMLFIYVKILIKINILDKSVIAKEVVFDNINEMVIVLDMDNKIIDVNEKAEQLFHDKTTNLIRRSLYRLLPVGGLIDALRENKETSFDFERPENDRLRSFRGEITLIRNNAKVIIIKDITDEVQMIKNLQYYATMDSLTEVFNRSHLFEVARKHLDACAANHEMFSLIMVDLDLFKHINDTYGHAAGDVVLKNVMKIARICLGDQVIIGRYGGEEFVIIMEQMTEDEVFREIETIRKEIMNFDHVYEDNIFRITCSFGIFTSDRISDLDEMIRKADEALYQSKSEGRNKTTIRHLD